MRTIKSVREEEREKALRERKNKRFNNLVGLCENRVEQVLSKKREDGQLPFFKSYFPKYANGSYGRKIFEVRLSDNGESGTFRVAFVRDNKTRIPLSEIPWIAVTLEMRDERIWERVKKLL